MPDTRIAFLNQFTYRSSVEWSFKYIHVISRVFFWKPRKSYGIFGITNAGFCSFEEMLIYFPQIQVVQLDGTVKNCCNTIRSRNSMSINLLDLQKYLLKEKGITQIISIPSVSGSVVGQWLITRSMINSFGWQTLIWAVVV